jgi:hypothetical protein
MSPTSPVKIASDAILQLMKHIVLGIISRGKSKDREYLLASSVLNFEKYTGYYYPPGGTLNNESDEKTALIKKLRDELRVKVTPLKNVAVTPADVENAVIHWWTCDADVNNIKVNSKRLKNYKWLTREQIINYQKVWPATKKFFEEYISD